MLNDLKKGFCNKCCQWYEIDRFYLYNRCRKNPNHFTICKSCQRKYAEKWYARNREKVSLHKKQWYKVNKEICKIRERRYHNNNRDKQHTKIIVAIAKQRGELILQPCFICGAIINVDAHHEDYSKPREVIWLCRLHHRQLHTGYINLK